MLRTAFYRRLIMAGFCVLAAQTLLPVATRAQSGDAFPDYALRRTALSGQADKQGVDRERQLALVSQRLDTTHAKRADGRDNVNTSSLAVRFAGPSADKSAAFDTRNHLSPEEARRSERLALWLAGDLTVDRARATDSRLATVHTDGLTFGTDARLGPRLVVGNALGTGFDRTGVGTDGWQGSRYVSDTLYASAFTGSQTYLDLAAGTAWTRFDTFYGAARGDRDARQFYALARYSRKYQQGRALLVPYGEAGLSGTAYGGYTEGGAGLACPAQSARSYHASLGLRGQTSFATRAGRVEPHAGMNVARSVKRLSAAVLATEYDGGRHRMSASLARTERLAATTGMKWAISDNATLDGQYAVTGDLGDFRPGQSVTATFKISF